MALNEDMALSTVQLVKEITPEMAKILAKLFETITSLSAGTGKLAWDVFFKESYENHLQESRRLKEAGMYDISKFLHKYENVTSLNVDAFYDADWKKEIFHDVMRKYRIPYALQNIGSGSEGIHIYVPTEYKMLWQEASKELFAKIASQKVTQESYEEEVHEAVIDTRHTNIISPEQLARIETVIDEQYFKYNQNPSWDNEKCFDMALENAAFSNINKDIFQSIGNSTKLQVLVGELRSVLGERAETDMLYLENEFLFFKDENQNFHFINLSNKSYMECGLGDIISFLKTKGVEEVNSDNVLAVIGEYMKTANQTLKQNQLLLDTKYKDYSPIQKEFIKETLLLEQKDPNIKLSQLDRQDFSVSKMVMLREAQVFNLDMVELLRNDYAAHQIQAFINLKILEKEVGGLQPDVYAMFKDKNLTRGETDAMLGAVVKNPLITAGELAEVREGVYREQVRLDNLIEYGTVEAPGHTGKDIENSIAEAKEEKALQELNNSEVLKEIKSMDKESLQECYRSEMESEHEDGNGCWKEYGSESKFEYFVNEKNEVKAVCVIDNVEKGAELEKALKDAPKYKDASGTKWYAYKELKPGTTIVVNEQGKAKMEVFLNKERLAKKSLVKNPIQKNRAALNKSKKKPDRG